jgi:hypothetical protein
MNSNSQQQPATASNSSNRIVDSSNIINNILNRLLISSKIVAGVAGVAG